jgi:UDP-glucose 4-epimerase
MINRMLQGKQPIIYGNGEQKRCFSFMQDVIDPLMIACETDVAHGRTINIGPDEEFITINELAYKLSIIFDFKLESIYMPGRPQEVFHANCSANLARELLNYKTTTSLDSGLVELVNWIKSKGAREFNYHLPLEFVTDKTPKTWTDRLM